MKKILNFAFAKKDDKAQERDLSMSGAFQESAIDRSIREIRLLLSQYSASTTSDVDKSGLLISLVRAYLSIAEASTSIHDTIDVNGIFRGDMKIVKIVSEHVWENAVSLTLEADVELWSYPQMQSRLAVPSTHGPSLLECIRFLRFTPFSQKSVCDTLVQTSLPTALCAFARFFCRLSFDLVADDAQSLQVSVMVYDMLRQFANYPGAIADIVRINRPKSPSGIELLFQALCIPVISSPRCHDDVLRFVSLLIFDKRFDSLSYQNMQHVQIIEMSLKSLKSSYQQPAVRRSVANWVIAICELVINSPLLRSDFDQYGGYQILTQVICWLASLPDDAETGHEIDGLVRVLMRMCFASAAEPSRRASLLSKISSPSSSKEANSITNMDALNSIVSIFVSNTSDFLSKICLARFTDLLGMSQSNYIASKSISALPIAIGMVPELSRDLRLELLTTLVLVSTSMPTFSQLPTTFNAPVEELELLADQLRSARCSPECCTDILETACKLGSFSEQLLRMLRDHKILEAALDRLHSVLSKKLREILPNAGADATQYHMRNIRNLDFDPDSGIIITAVLNFCNKIMTNSPAGIQICRAVRLKSLDAFILLIDAPAFRRQSIVLLHQIILRSPDSLSHDVEKIMKLLETFSRVDGNFSVKSDLCSLLSAIFRDSSVARAAFANCRGFELTLQMLHKLKNSIDSESDSSHYEEVLVFMMSVLGLICSAGRGRLGSDHSAPSGSHGDGVEDDIVFMEQEVEILASSYVPTGVPLSKDGPSAHSLLLATLTPQLIASLFHGSGVMYSRYAYFAVMMLLEASLGTADQPLLFPRSIITRINTDAMSVEFFYFDLVMVESFQSQKIDIPNQTVIQHSSFCVASMILCVNVPEHVSSRILTLIAVLICSIPPNANRIALNFGVSATLDLVIRFALSRQESANTDSQLYATCLQILSTLCSHFVSTNEAVLLMCACRHPIVGSNIIESLISSLSAAANSPSIYFLASSPSSKGGRPTKFRSSIEIFGEQSTPGHLVLDVLDENPMLWPPSGGVSFSIWVYIDDYSESKSVSVLTVVSDVGSALSCIKLFDGNVAYQIAGKDVYVFSSCEMYQHRWHHICITHKSTLVGGLGLQSDCYLYLDGVRRQRAQLPYKNSSLFSKDVYVSAFVVGSNGKFEDASESATWRAGSVLVMSEVLDEQRVRSLFRAGPGSVTTIQGSSYTDKNPEAELSAFICRSEAHDRFLDLPDLSIRLNQDRIIVALAPALAQVMLPDELPKESLRIREMMRFFLGLETELRSLSFCDDALRSADSLLADRTILPVDDPLTRIQFDELCHSERLQPHQKEASVPDISKWSRSARVMGFSFIMPSRPFADSLQALGGIAPIFSLIEDATTDGNLILSLSMLSASIQGHVTNTFQFESMNGADLLASILQHHQISKTRSLPTAALVPHLMAIVGWDVARPRLSVVSSIQSCRALLLDSRIWSHDVSVIPQVMECLTGFIEGNTYKKWNCQRLVQAQALQYVCLNISRGFLDRNSVEKSVQIIQHVLIEMFKNLSTPTSQAQSLDRDLQDVVLLLSFTIHCASGSKKGADVAHSLNIGSIRPLSPTSSPSEGTSFYSTFRRDVLLAHVSSNQMSKDEALTVALEENIFLRLQVLRALNVVLLCCPNGTVNLLSVKQSLSADFFVMLLKTDHKETHVATIRLLLTIMNRVQGYDEFFAETKGWSVMQYLLCKSCLCKTFALFAAFFISFNSGILAKLDPSFEASDSKCSELIAEAVSVAPTRIGSHSSIWFLFALLDDASRQEKTHAAMNDFASSVVAAICMMMDKYQSVSEVLTSPDIISCMASIIFSSRITSKSQEAVSIDQAADKMLAAVLTVDAGQLADETSNVFKTAFQNFAGAASAMAADIMDLSTISMVAPEPGDHSVPVANADLVDDESREWDIIAHDEVNASEFMILNLSSKTELADIRFELEHKVATIMRSACKSCSLDIRKCASLPYIIFESVSDQVPTANVATFSGEMLGGMLLGISTFVENNTRTFDMRDFVNYANFAEEFVSATAAGFFPLANDNLTLVLCKFLESVLQFKTTFEDSADVFKIVRRFRGALLRSLAIGCSAIRDDAFYASVILGAQVIHLLLPAPGSPGLLDSYLAAFCFALTELFLDDTFPQSRDAALSAWKGLLEQQPVTAVVEQLTRFVSNGNPSSLTSQGFELIFNDDSRKFREWLVANHEFTTRVLKTNVQSHIRTLQSFESRSLRGCSERYKNKKAMRLERLNRSFSADAIDCERRIVTSLANFGARSEEFLFTMNKRMQARDAQASFAEQSWHKMRADADVASNVILTSFNDHVWLHRGSSIVPLTKSKEIHSFSPAWSSLFVIRPSPFYKLGPIEGPDSTRLHLVAHHEFLDTYQKQPLLRHENDSTGEHDTSSQIEMYGPLPKMVQAAMRADAESLALADPVALSVPLSRKNAAVPSDHPSAAISPSKKLTFDLGERFAAFGKDKEEKKAENVDSLVMKDDRFLWVVEQGDAALHAFNYVRLKGSERLAGLMLVCNNCMFLFGDLQANAEGELQAVKKEYKQKQRFSDASLNIMTEEMQQGPGRGQGFVEGIHTVEKIAFADICEISSRKCLQRPVGIEIFTEGGEGMLFAFNKSERNFIYDFIRQRCPRLRRVADSSDVSSASHSFGGGELKSLQKAWRMGEISNFRYLMLLNLIAGRSFNDYTQYPVMPWIIADYDSAVLDLSDNGDEEKRKKTFRDLSKPMGAQGKSRAEEFQSRFVNWPDETTPAFHYGTHYSSSAGVMYYLLRLEPFARHHLLLQSGHFDHSDRLFQGLKVSWESSSAKSVGDVKELTPEFFFLPEVFCNAMDFALGYKQNGVLVDDIVLPKWSFNDPVEFIRAHRRALECDYVSMNLHHWIDLIFGERQRGELAKESINVFPHLSYEGIDIDSIEDPCAKLAALGQILNFGQTPKQLWQKGPHPAREKSSSSPTICGHPSILVSQPLKSVMGRVSSVQVCEGNIVSVGGFKLLVPPSYTKYISWEKPDGGLRFHTAVVTPRHLRVNELSHLFEHMHASPITACAISDDGSHLVTGAVDGGIAIWEHVKGANSSRTLTLKKRMFGHVGMVTCIRICGLHGIVVSGSVDCSVVMWNMRTGHRLFCVLNIPSTITALDVGPAMGMLWIVASKSLFITTINGHPLLDMFCSVAITAVAVGPAPEWHDNNLFVTGHEDGSLRFWKLRHEQAFNKPECPSDNGTVVFQRGRYRAFLMAVYNRETPNFTGEIHATAVSHIKFLNDISVVTGSADGVVLQWGLVGTGQTTHWMHDSAVSECNECGVKFNLVERKHHCRNCGYVFCAKCTSKKHAIPELSFFQPVRVCNSCHVVLSNPKGVRPKSPLSSPS